MELVNGRYRGTDSFTNLKTGGKQLINNQMPCPITDIENRFVRGRARNRLCISHPCVPSTTTASELLMIIIGNDGIW